MPNSFFSSQLRQVPLGLSQGTPCPAFALINVLHFSTLFSSQLTPGLVQHARGYHCSTSQHPGESNILSLLCCRRLQELRSPLCSAQAGRVHRRFLCRWLGLGAHSLGLPFPPGLPFPLLPGTAGKLHLSQCFNLTTCRWRYRS